MWVSLALKLIPILVQIAEHVFNTPKSGMLKKEFVLDVAGHVAQGVGAAVTGGAAETWTRIAPDVATMVDAAASVAFPSKSSSGPFGGN